MHCIVVNKELEVELDKDFQALLQALKKGEVHALSPAICYKLDLSTRQNYWMLEDEAIPLEDDILDINNQQV